MKRRNFLTTGMSVLVLGYASTASATAVSSRPSGRGIPQHLDLASGIDERDEQDVLELFLSSDARAVTISNHGQYAFRPEKEHNIRIWARALDASGQLVSASWEELVEIPLTRPIASGSSAQIDLHWKNPTYRGIVQVFASLVVDSSTFYEIQSPEVVLAWNHEPTH